MVMLRSYRPIMAAPAVLVTSHTTTLRCGCTVYVSCHPGTGVAHTRIIERRAPQCGDRHHDVGQRLSASDLQNAELRTDRLPMTVFEERC